MYTRLATPADIDKIARVASRATGPAGNGLWVKAIYPDMTADQHLGFMRDRVATWFANPGYVIHVAVGETGDGTETANSTVPEHSYTAHMARLAAVSEAKEAAQLPAEIGERIIGVISYIRRDVNNLGPPPRVPDLRPEMSGAADLTALGGYLQQSKEWKEDALKVFGVYYHGGHLSVARVAERHGVGSALCRLLLADMLSEPGPVPLLMETDYYAMPFYDRFAELNGLRTTIFGRPYKIPTKRMELFMYFIQIEKAPVRTLLDEMEMLRKMPGNTIQR